MYRIERFLPFSPPSPGTLDPPILYRESIGEQIYRSYDMYTLPTAVQ